MIRVIALILCVVCARAAVKKPVADSATPEGRLLAKVYAEHDPARKTLLLELIPELFPSSASTVYAWSELQQSYLAAGKLSNALAAGSSVLVADPNNLEVACLNWRIAVDMKDASLTEAWIKQTAKVASQALKAPNPEMSKATLECGANARQSMEIEEYRTAVTAKDAAQRIQLLDEFVKNHSQNSHADDIEITQFLAYRELGQTAKALAMAEKIVAHNETREDAMLVVAEAYFKAGKDPNRVVSLSKKVIDRLNSAEKPTGISAADWARNKAQSLTLAHYMVGSVSFKAERWEAADQAFRAALPNLTDPRFKADVLNSLGWSNYKLRNVADAIKFYTECTAIPGPLQQAAAKTLDSITAEYRLR